MTHAEAIAAIKANWPTENYTMLREALTLACAALASPPAEDENALRAAWEAGFRLCRRYGDNHHHWDGEQRERRWRQYLAQVAQAPPASDPPGLATWQGHDDCPTCGQPAKWKPLGQYMRTVDRRATLAARQSDPPGLASLTRSLCEALWDLQSSPDCWCPPDRSCTEPHTEACAAARAVNGAAKRFHLYNELPLAAPASPQAKDAVQDVANALHKYRTSGISLTVEGHQNIAEVIDALRAAGYVVQDATED